MIVVNSSLLFMQRHISLKIEKSIEVLIKPRKNGKSVCQSCKKEASVYDTSQTPRKFESVPVLKYQVFFFIPEGGFNVLPVV